MKDPEMVQCKKEDGPMGAVLFFVEGWKLEVETQRHLNLPGSADGVLHNAQTGGAVVKSAGERG